MTKTFTKKIIASIIIFIMIFGMLSLYSKSYGATYTYTASTNDLPSNFDALYPGYRNLINSLATNHPNWTFKLYETGLDWETVINNEYSGHGVSPKNLSPANDSRYSGDWICSICRTKTYDSGSWYCSSREAIKYMMDPRNSLNESDLFQFQELYSSTADTKELIQKAIVGTFFNTPECADAIYNAATLESINSLHLISRIIQEQGSGTSPLASGITENGVTYYNLFNIEAYPTKEADLITNGFNKAKREGWTSMAASIQGGAKFLKDEYINKGQNTLYYQKFNVIYQDNLYGHQYMQNILAAQNEGTTIKSKYINLSTENNNLLTSNFTFNIPLYLNMPGSACARPSTISTSTPVEGELAYVNADGGLALRASPNGNTIDYINKNEQVIITERATEKIGGYYWDKVSTSKGTGYMARESSTGDKTYLVVIKEGAGDCNGDGKVDSMDMYQIIQHILGNITLEGNFFEAVDTNGDKKIDSMDMYNVIQIILKR